MKITAKIIDRVAKRLLSERSNVEYEFDIGSRVGIVKSFISRELYNREERREWRDAEWEVVAGKKLLNDWAALNEVPLWFGRMEEKIDHVGHYVGVEVRFERTMTREQYFSLKKFLKI
jgi:hypothetical protein